MEPAGEVRQRYLTNLKMPQQVNDPTVGSFLPNFPMKALFCLIVAVFGLGIVPTLAQCDPDPPQAGDGMVIVNEVGNLGRNAEYVELLVVGNPANPRAPVDMTDWILDDNNYARVDHGNEPGHLRFGACFNAVPPGTLIVIYNSGETPSGLNTGSDGFPNPAGVYQSGAGSSCLYGCEGSPNHHSANYAKTQIVAGDWLRLVPLRNWGDGIQVRNAGAGFKHGVYWGNCIFGGGGVKVALPAPGQSIAGLVIQYMAGAGGWNSAANFSTGPTGTPGMPNSPENAAWIAALRQ